MTAFCMKSTPRESLLQPVMTKQNDSVHQFIAQRKMKKRKKDQEKNRRQIVIIDCCDDEDDCNGDSVNKSNKIDSHLPLSKTFAEINSANGCVQRNKLNTAGKMYSQNRLKNNHQKQNLREEKWREKSKKKNKKKKKKKKKLTNAENDNSKLIERKNSTRKHSFTPTVIQSTSILTNNIATPVVAERCIQEPSRSLESHLKIRDGSSMSKNNGILKLEEQNSSLTMTKNLNEITENRKKNECKKRSSDAMLDGTKNILAEEKNDTNHSFGNTIVHYKNNTSIKSIRGNNKGSSNDQKDSNLQPPKRKKSKQQVMMRALLNLSDASSSNDESEIGDDDNFDKEGSNGKHQNEFAKKSSCTLKAAHPISKNLRNDNENSSSAATMKTSSKFQSKYNANSCNSPKDNQSYLLNASGEKCNELSMKDKDYIPCTFLEELSSEERNFLQYHVKTAKEFLDVDPNIWAKALHQSKMNTTSNPSCEKRIQNGDDVQEKSIDSMFSLDFCRGMVHSWTLRAKMCRKKQLTDKPSHLRLDSFFSIMDASMITLLKANGIFYVQQFLNANDNLLEQTYSVWIQKRFGKTIQNSDILKNAVSEWRKKVREKWNTNKMQQTKNDFASANQSQNCNKLYQHKTKQNTPVNESKKENMKALELNLEKTNESDIYSGNGGNAQERHLQSNHCSNNLQNNDSNIQKRKNKPFQNSMINVDQGNNHQQNEKSNSLDQSPTHLHSTNIMKQNCLQLKSVRTFKEQGDNNSRQDHPSDLSSLKIPLKKLPTSSTPQRSPVSIHSLQENLKTDTRTTLNKNIIASSYGINYMQKNDSNKRSLKNLQYQNKDASVGNLISKSKVPPILPQRPRISTASDISTPDKLSNAFSKTLNNNTSALNLGSNSVQNHKNYIQGQKINSFHNNQASDKNSIANSLLYRMIPLRPSINDISDLFSQNKLSNDLIETSNNNVITSKQQSHPKQNLNNAQTYKSSTRDQKNNQCQHNMTNKNNGKEPQQKGMKCIDKTSTNLKINGHKSWSVQGSDKNHPAQPSTNQATFMTPLRPTINGNFGISSHEKQNNSRIKTADNNMTSPNQQFHATRNLQNHDSDKRERNNKLQNKMINSNKGRDFQKEERNNCVDESIQSRSSLIANQYTAKVDNSATTTQPAMLYNSNQGLDSVKNHSNILNKTPMKTNGQTLNDISPFSPIFGLEKDQKMIFLKNNEMFRKKNNLH